MSDGEVKFVSEDSVKSSGSIIKMDQCNGKRSFLITVDDKGKIEVSPKEQTLEEHSNCQQSKCDLKPKKASRRGRQRIRIALIEEDADSSEEDQDVSEDKNDVVNIDAPSFEAMHDQFVQIYNKKLRGKPSFVVLEDALVRKRIEETLQDHYTRTTSHAQQQTSSCDIGAHTGSQTDEFLLQYALRSQMKGHSRGCQATDVNMERSHTSTTKRSLHVPPSLRRLNQLHHNNQSETLAITDTASHVTISIIPPTAAAMSAVVQPQQLLLPAATHNYANCCSSNCNCPHCNNSNYCPSVSNSNCSACFVKSPHLQQQQQLQQHPNCGNCHSSCCLLRPSLAQTTLGYGMPSHCSQHMLLMPETAAQQQRSDYPSIYYPMPTCNMAALGLPHCANCRMQQYHQQQQQQQQQHIGQADSSSNSMHINYSSTHPETQSTSERSKKLHINERKNFDESMELETSVSQVTVKRMNSSSMPATSSANKKHEKKLRHRAGGTSSSSSTSSSKLYMARFGRTCLILQPNECPMPPRLPTKNISRCTSVMALPQK